MKRNTAKYLKRAIAITMLLVIVILFMSLVQTPYGHVCNIIQGFYREERNSIDVVFFGASEVSAGYSATYAYSLYGYTSYPYAVDGNQLNNLKYQLEEVYNYQSPKLVVIDISCATSYSHRSDDDTPSRAFVDNIPLSEHKLELMRKYDFEERINCLFPFITHHGFLPDFEYLRFLFRRENVLKGTYARSSKIEEMGEVFDLDKEKLIVPNEIISEIDELLDLCETMKINVVFARFPNRVNNNAFLKRYHECNYVLDYIESRGFSAIDCMDDDFISKLDYQNDFYTNDHMSICGQKKLTQYIGNVLKNQYHITESNLSPKNKMNWEKSRRYIKLFYEYVEKVEESRKPDEVLYIYETSELLSVLDSMDKENE